MKALISALALVAALAGASESRPALYSAPRRSYGGYGGYGGRGGYSGRAGLSRGGYGGYAGGRGYSSGLGRRGLRGGYAPIGRGGYATGLGRGGYGSGLGRAGGYAAPLRRGGYGGRGGYSGYGGRGRLGGYAGRGGLGGYSRPGSYGGAGYGAGLGSRGRAGYGGYGATGGYGGYGQGAYGHGGHGLAGSYGSYGPRPSPRRAYRPAGGAVYRTKPVKLDADTFKYTVLRDKKHVWVVAFIDPACGNCKRFAIEWERLQTIETITYKKVKLGYVDVSAAGTRQIVGKYTAGKEIVGVPKVFVYGQDKLHPTEISGNLSRKAVLDKVHDVCFNDECKAKDTRHAIEDAEDNLSMLKEDKAVADKVLSQIPRSSVSGLGMQYASRALPSAYGSKAPINFGESLNFDEFGPQLQAKKASPAKTGYVEGVISQDLWEQATGNLGSNSKLAEFGFGAGW